jgi:hypothetical protein
VSIVATFAEVGKPAEPAIGSLHSLRSRNLSSLFAFVFFFTISTYMKIATFIFSGWEVCKKASIAASLWVNVSPPAGSLFIDCLY